MTTLPLNTRGAPVMVAPSFGSTVCALQASAPSFALSAISLPSLVPA